MRKLISYALMGWHSSNRENATIPRKNKSCQLLFNFPFSIVGKDMLSCF